MAQKKAGRKPKKAEDKVISIGTYLTRNEKKLVEKKFGSTTQAIRKVVLPMCG